METIYVKVDKVYGKEVIYPVCDKAKYFAQIAGTVTLTRDTLKWISKLGYCIEVPQTEYSFS